VTRYTDMFKSEAFLLPGKPPAPWSYAT